MGMILRIFETLESVERVCGVPVWVSGLMVALFPVGAVLFVFVSIEGAKDWSRIICAMARMPEPGNARESKGVKTAAAIWAAAELALLLVAFVFGAVRGA